MATISVRVSSSSGTADQQSGVNDAGRAYTGAGVVTLGRGVFSPGSHGGNDEWSNAIYFGNITIPQGATINSATITFRVQSGWDAAALGRVIKYYVSLQASDNAGVLTNSSGTLNTSNRPRTTATTVWTQNTTTTNQLVSVDIKTALQELVNRAGWASGNAAVGLIDTHEDTTQGEWQEYDDYVSSSANAPLLDADYTSGSASAFPSAFTTTRLHTIDTWRVI